MKKISFIALLCALFATIIFPFSQEAGFPKVVFALETIWDGSANTAWYEDEQLEFTLTTPEQFAGLVELVNGGNNFSGKTIKLGNHLVFNNTSDWENWDRYTLGLNRWTAIGNEENEFIGVLDGQNYTLSGIWVNNDYQEIVSRALFNVIGEGGALENLGIIKSVYCLTIPSGSALAAINDGTIRNCYTGAKITTQAGKGGLVYHNTGLIENSYNTASLSLFSSIGGIASINEGTIKNCYNTGDMTGVSWVGGIVSENSGLVINCYNRGRIAGSGNITAGIVSTNKADTVNG